MINLRLLEVYASEEGARGLFQQLIAQLAGLRYGDDARTIEPAPGDWGIDVLVGKLTSGPCLVWQAKYFPKVPGKKQKEEIIDSFTKLNEKRLEQNFQVNAWFLCMPSAFSPQMTVWWERWKALKTAETGIVIELWHKDYLEKLLINPNARHIVEAFGLDGINMPSIRNERIIVPLPPNKIAEYEKALFIKKLIHAGITENSSARSQFFNAELVQREIRARGDTSEASELNGIYEKILGLWEDLFNKAMDRSDSILETKRVFFQMNDLLLELDREYLYCPKIAASLFHKKGFMHQLSDDCKLGWSPDHKTLAGEN